MHEYQNKMLNKKQLLRLMIRRKLRVDFPALCYKARVIVVEEKRERYTLKHPELACTDHYLIPVCKRGDYYIRKWEENTIIIRKRKNLLFLNQVSTFVNLIWSML